ncbi:hypothetical protein [Aeromicrobium sp.]|uniref:hypothetical protein n=1 Tax=Aeromicrobium sp. TaxID=1871063 RepID=UPI003C5FF78E
MTVDHLANALLVLVGLVNAVPGLIGSLSVERAATAYGIAVDSPDLAVVLRHRGVLLLIVGLGLIVAPWWPEIRTAAIAAGVISMASYVAIALAKPGLGRPLRKVMWVDVGALALVAVAVVLLAAG